MQSFGRQRSAIDALLGERDAQMRIVSQFVVMHGDQKAHSRVDVLHLDQRHFVVFLEEFELHDFVLLENFQHLFLGYAGRNVGQMEG